MLQIYFSSDFDLIKSELCKKMFLGIHFVLFFFFFKKGGLFGKFVAAPQAPFFGNGRWFFVKKILGSWRRRRRLFSHEQNVFSENNHFPPAARCRKLFFSPKTRCYKPDFFFWPVASPQAPFFFLPNNVFDEKCISYRDIKNPIVLSSIFPFH